MNETETTSSMYKFDVDDAVKSLKQFNEDPISLASDRLMDADEVVIEEGNGQAVFQHLGPLRKGMVNWVNRRFCILILRFCRSM